MKQNYERIVCVSANSEYQDQPHGEGPGDKAVLTCDDGTDESSPFVTVQELQEHIRIRFLAISHMLNTFVKIL